MLKISLDCIKIILKLSSRTLCFTELTVEMPPGAVQPSPSRRLLGVKLVPVDNDAAASIDRSNSSKRVISLLNNFLKK